MTRISLEYAYLFLSAFGVFMTCRKIDMMEIYELRPQDQ